MANIKENKRFHFTYRTTNLINSRYYLGMHSTNRIDDGYLGSGKRLYYELNKYGRNNFKFEILEQFNSREELVEAEINLITEHDLKNPNCLNMSPGGSGGIRGEEHYNAFVKGPKNIGPMIRKRAELREDQEWKQKIPLLIKAGLRRVQYDHATFRGKKHTQETLSKMRESKTGQGKGNLNSQYGTCWITNEIQNKKIYKGDLIPEGWRLGRVLKNKN
jgi:hypothetical protein